MISISAIDVALKATDTDAALVPLSERFNTALANYYVKSGHQRDAILAGANDPVVAADPHLLYDLQVRQEAYTKQISLSSALVSHATKGIETLVKS
ncbi:type III secretion system inner rod subunit SctI [Stenotrophomonas indicatrix]|uniref:type III secretion system inner rod subunit SctI n=1 Tax=Stenotrophomonas indicatrix TaxID=2045451 RepID=UPI00300A644B